MTWWNRLWRRKQMDEQLEKELRFLITVNMTVVAPMPSPSVNSATAANPGLWRKVRRAYRKSCHRSSSQRVPRASRHCSFTCSGQPKARRACLRASSGRSGGHRWRLGCWPSAGALGGRDAVQRAIDFRHHDSRARDCRAIRELCARAPGQPCGPGEGAQAGVER
jgi:hypothetical protein